MFVDTAKVSLKAGKGGDGAVSFRHEIYIPKGGPDGGDGGKGGDIIFRADRNTNTLVDFRFTPILTAEDGKNGSGQRSAGRSGKDLIVDVPVGTVVYRIGDANSSSSTGDETGRGPQNVLRSKNFGEGEVSAGPVERSGSKKNLIAETVSAGPVERSGSKKNLIADLTEDGAEVIIAHGGSGGFGNAHFKSSTRQAPIIAEVGEPGEEFTAELELKSMADVGLVGLPNAGKSTFLSVVSNAKPEIADYPFTTITPNLGVATIDEHDILIADIPGLIEGASEGKGLGHDFLRHVDRTAVLLHLVDVYNDDAGEAYQTIRNELEKYSDLASRPEIVALTKCEGVDNDIIKMQTASILEKNPDAKVYTISSSAHQGLTELLRELKQSLTSAGDDTWGTPFELDENGGKVSAGPVERKHFIKGEVSAGPVEGEMPVISLSKDALKDTWTVEKLDDDRFRVTGEKIEKFARRTDLNNYASINRLRDIMKKMGIRAELTTKGAKPESIIEIAGKEFTLVEDW
ncbi:GTPase ObgE [Candidatus Saccharibacteria bacterium]|nr:GTPase ObgE [Candidatus Saccharibacteria bacterium]